MKVLSVFVVSILLLISSSMSIEIISLDDISFEKGECDWHGVSYPCELDSISLHRILDKYNVYSLNDRFHDERDTVYSMKPLKASFFYADRVISIGKVKEIKTKECGGVENISFVYIVSQEMFRINKFDSIEAWDDIVNLKFIYDLKTGESLCRTSGKILY